MSRFFTLTTLFLLTAFSLRLPSALSTPTCRRGDPNNNAYIERNGDKRCEGITSSEIASQDFGVCSFIVGQLVFTEPLSLQIPKVAALPTEPHVRIQSTQKYYQLDPLGLQYASSQWQFHWSNKILREQSISSRSLRGLAQSGSEGILLPILLSKADTYEIRICTNGRAKEIILHIQTLTGQERYTSRQSNRPGNEVVFMWNGTDSQKKPLPPGRYKLQVEAQIEQPNAPPSPRNLIRQFEHNPAWLK